MQQAEGNIRHLDIQIRGDHRNKGIGFSVMQSAYRFGIHGSFSYKEGQAVFIEAEGTSEQIADFREWCIGFFAPKPCEFINNRIKKYREFNIVNTNHK